MRELLFWGVIFGSFPVIWRRPYWGIVFYGVLNIIRPELLFWGARSYNKAGLYVFVVTAFSTLFKSKLDIKSAKSPLFLFLWLAIALKVSIYLSEFQIERAHYYANELWKIFLFCTLLTILVNDENKTKTLENVFLGCMTFLGVWAIEQHFGGNERLENFGNMDSNGLASFFVLFAPLAYNKMFDKSRRRNKVLGAVSSIVFIITIVFTQSRGGFLGLVAASLMWLRGIKEKTKVMFSGVVVLIILMPFISSEYVNRLETMKPVDGEIQEGSAASRLILWEVGLMVFRDNPVVGTGFMTYRLSKMKYKSNFDYLGGFQDVVFRTKRPKVTHNTYIQLLSDGGLLLATPYFLLILITVLGSRAIKKKIELANKKSDLLELLLAINSGLCGYWVCAFFQDDITFVHAPVQITISAIIRSQLHRKLSQSEV